MKRSDPGGFWLLLIALAILLPSIWLESSLTGGDEHRISFRTALETQQADQWLVPTYEGEPRLRKPPLFYWVLAASSEYLGSSLFSMRIWGVLCGALLAIFVARWGHRQFSADPVLTFVIFVSCLGLATESRRAMLDIPMTLFLVLALERWGRCMMEGRSIDAVIAGAFLAVAAMIKPPAIYFAATAIIAMTLFQVRVALASAMIKRFFGFTLFIISFSLFFFPWWVYVQSVYPELLQARLEEQITNREISAFKVESIPSLLGGWLGLVAPWSITLIYASLRYLRKTKDGIESPERWLAIFLILSSVPFLFMKTFERYLIPLLPAFSILISAYLDTLKPSALRRHLFGAAFLTSTVTLVLAVIVWWFFSPTLALISVAILLLLWRMAMQADAVNTALAAALNWCFCLGVLLPSIGIGEGPPLSKEIQQRPIYQMDGRHLPMLEITVGKPIEDISNDLSSLGQLPDETCYLILTEADLPKLEVNLAELDRESEVLRKFGVFRSRKVFTRFVREDATAEDLQKAKEERSLEGLKKRCVIVEIKSR